MQSNKCQISGEYCISLDEHHIIPREYGGINGPTILLSPTIHQTIHRIYNNDSKVADLISRYPFSSKKIHYLVQMLRYADQNLSKVQSNNVVINLNNFSEEEQNYLIENANKLDISLSSLITKMIKEVLTKLRKNYG